MSDKGEQNYKSYHHSESTTNTSYNSHKEPFLCVNKPSNVAHSDRLETFDDIDSAVSSIIIDEKVGEDENYAQTSCTQISYNDQSLNSMQTVSSFSHVSSTDICQVTPKHIISSVEPKNHCNLISSSKTKDIGKYEQIIHDSSAYEYESTIDYNRYVDFDSFHFYPPDYTNFNELDAFDANSLMNQNIHCIQDTKISPVNIQQDYNIDLMDDNHILIEEESKIKKLRDSTQYQNDPTIFGLIIPQSSNDDNEEEDYISKSEDEFIQDNETDSKRLSKHLDAINVKNECSNYLSSQLIDYYMRRQSYPTSNDTEISSTISSKLSSRRERYLISQFSYFDQNEYDFDDTDDVSTLTFLEDQHNTPIKSQSNRPEHDKLTSTNMDLIFPYSLEEPWDYAEDLRKIDEDIYKRTTPPDTTTTTDGIVSSITSLDKHNIINSGISTNVASNDNYYTDNVMRSSFSDYENVHSLDKQSVNMSQFHTVERSMNELYLNWLNDLNMSYYRDQQDNLTKNDYNVKTNDYNYTELPFSDHNTSQSITSNLVTSEASITPSSTSNSKAIIATTSSTTEQNVILKRCPNFENISCLSSGSEIDLTQHDSDVYGTSMNVSDMNEEKEDIEINNDKPMKVWGREYRDKLQTVDPSTCLTNIYNNIQPELDIWSNLFNTSEIVVDTAREISAQLNFLSSLEGSEREEAGGDGKEREREIITHRISHKDDDNRTEMLTDQMLATVATTTTVTSVTTSESSHQHISCNEDIIENIEKYGGIVSSHIITCPTFPVQTSQKLISYDQGENISYSESLSSVTKSAVSKHSNRYTDIIEENVANPTVSTFLSNKTTSNEFHPYGKFSSDANQSMQTLLQKNNHLMKTGEKREEKVEKTEDLYHSDTCQNPMHTYIDPSQGSSIDFGEEGRSMKSANHKEVRKSSLQLDEAPHTTSFVRLDSDQSLQYPIDQSNFNNSQSSIYQFQCFNNKYGDKFLTEPNLIFNKRYNEIAYTQGEYGTFLKDDLNLRIVACSKSSDISSKLLGNHFFTRENTSCEINVSNCQLPKTTGSPHLSVKQTITGSSTKSSCYSSEKALKRAQLILSTSPVDEPDPTDTFLALTDSNNTSGDRFSRLHEKDLSKSPIKSYFLSLSCPQSLSSQLIDDNNYDTLSECSNFSIHIPVPSSKYNENVLSESQLSSPLNFDEFYANRNLWEPFHSHWYIHILKRISQETILTSIPEQTSDNENIHTEYMSSSSSSRGSYFAPQRRRPHSSTYSYEVNTFGDDLPGAYESPNSSSSAVYLGQSYNNHKSLHDIYPDRSVRQLDYNDSYRTNVKVSPKSNLKGHYNNRPYRSYSQASTSFQPKDKVGVASVIRHDHRSKLGLIHPPGRFKHLKSVDIETALQQRILKEASRGPKPFSDYETGPRLRRAPLRSYTPTYKALQTPQSKWSNDPSYLETGSYFSLPLHDYQRQATKYSRSSSTNRRHAPSSTDTSLHRRILSDEWDHFSRNIGKLSKSTGHLSHLDDLGKISGCTSMQTLRARLAAAHSEFNLDDQEELSDSIHSQRFKSERFGSLDRQIGSNELTTRQLRRQVEQHHRRLLKV
ncbi:unnamed protein product [Heterobilharzia americana]|nr:unnamed protein product [Heterobilharzia americana]